MDAQNIAAIATLIVGFIGFVWRAVKWRDRLRDEYRENQRKLGIMWSYLMDRGHLKSELDDNGIEMPRFLRPGTLTDEVRNRFEPIRLGMQANYKDKWRELSDEDAMLEIQGEHGKDILRHVCRPLRWTDGECLQAALIIAKEAIAVI